MEAIAQIFSTYSSVVALRITLGLIALVSINIHMHIASYLF